MIIFDHNIIIGEIDYSYKLTSQWISGGVVHSEYNMAFAVGLSKANNWSRAISRLFNGFIFCDNFLDNCFHLHSNWSAAIQFGKLDT